MMMPMMSAGTRMDATRYLRQLGRVGRPLIDGRSAMATTLDDDDDAPDSLTCALVCP